jgi:hypothetical protein
MVQEDLREMGIEGWRRKAQDKRPVEANSTGSQGSRRAVAPSEDDDADNDSLGFVLFNTSFRVLQVNNVLNSGDSCLSHRTFRLRKDKYLVLMKKTNEGTCNYIRCLFITLACFGRLLRPSSGCTVLKSTKKVACGESVKDLDL